MFRNFRRLKVWAMRAVIAVLVILVVIVAPAAFILYPTLKSYPAVETASASTQAEKTLQDLAFLRKLPQVDRSFSDQSRAGFDAALDALEARASELDRAAFAIGAARAVALADNGHTNVHGLVAGHGFNVVPIRVGWFDDGLFVVATGLDQRDLLGANVTGVNGRPAEEVASALRTLVGGPENLAREFVPNFIQSPELLHAAGLGDSADAATFQVILRDGSQTEVSLAANPGEPEPMTRSFWPKRHLSPVAMPEEKASWTHVLDAASPPYLSRPDLNVWHDYLDDGSVLYVQINRVRDQDGSMRDYLADAMKEAASRQVKHAVVDLRFNPGGNYELTGDFSQALPDLLPADGKVFILASGNTFSAAISTASRLLYFAGPRAVLVGEPMGDRPRFWAEGGSARMPNAGLSIRYSTAYHDWENGCSLPQIRTCFFLNYIYAKPAGSLAPDIAVGQTFASYAAGKDAVLEKAMQLARQAD